MTNSEKTVPAAKHQQQATDPDGSVLNTCNLSNHARPAPVKTKVEPPPAQPFPRCG